jgi:uncharacterized membrane protein
MDWILLALLGPLFWAGSNIFDKYALEKVSRGVYDFLFFGTLGSIFIVILTLLVYGLEYIGILSLYPILAGFFVQFSYLFYSYALEKEDASYVVPLYITYAVVVLVLGPLFGETISTLQLIAFGVVFLGALFLSLEKLSFELFKHRKGAILMIPAILLLSIAILLTDQSLEILSFSDTFIYDLIGFSLAGFSLLLVPRWRREIVKGIKTARMRKYSLFLINDTLDMSGHLIYKYALLLAPSASLVAVLGGIQPFYVLVLGGLFTVFFPHIISENISREEILQKVVGVTIIVVGISILSLYS